MAVQVNYWLNTTECYTEGPFVLTVVSADDYRVECELKDWHCPVLLDSSVYRLIERNNYKSRSREKEDIINTVNWLNTKVKTGIIICQNGVWKVSHV